MKLLTNKLYFTKTEIIYDATQLYFILIIWLIKTTTQKYKCTLIGFFVFNGISTFLRLFNAKAILQEEQ